MTAETNIDIRLFRDHVPPRLCLIANAPVLETRRVHRVISLFAIPRMQLESFRERGKSESDESMQSPDKSDWRRMVTDTMAALCSVER
jgi:hypothetical protein